MRAEAWDTAMLQLLDSGEQCRVLTPGSTEEWMRMSANKLLIKGMHREIE